jgi:hypothetical protein
MGIFFSKVFILLCAAFILAGWFLSILGQLAGLGYLFAIPIFFIALWKICGGSNLTSHAAFKIRWRRYKSIIPFSFLTVFALCTIGAITHPPNNYDFLTYRLSRIFHWLESGQWHWISTINPRMNYSGPNAEWILSPLFTLLQSDKLYFIPNIFAFSLLPSAIFLIFRGMGISGRAAWWAMWIVPSAYCFVSQAGSAGNDFLGASFFIISLAFLFRAKKTGEFGWAGMSVLAISICTGIKASNLPLGLVWIVAAWPTLSIFFISWKKSVVVAILAIFCSFIPIAALNTIHSGSWKGSGSSDENLVAKSPLGGLAGNIILTVAGCIQPPVLPAPAPINRFLNESLPESVVNLLNRDFPRFILKLGELPNEEGAGLGVGVAGILVLGLMTIPLFKIRSNETYFNRLGLFIFIANFVALSAYMVLMASESAARLLTPYYFIALALPFAILGNSDLLKSKIWKSGVFLVMASSMIIPLTTPSRPILPIAQLAEYFLPESNLANRINEVYAVYANRSDNLAPVRNLLPEDANRIGFISSGDDSEVSLWKPYGSKRSVVHIIPGRPFPEDLDALVVSKHGLQIFFDGDLSQIVEFDDYYKLGWNKIGTKMITSKVQEGPIEWLIFSKDSNRDDSLD